jgi:hypothetical protein
LLGRVQNLEAALAHQVLVNTTQAERITELE